MATLLKRYASLWLLLSMGIGCGDTGSATVTGTISGQQIYPQDAIFFVADANGAIPPTLYLAIAETSDLCGEVTNNQFFESQGLLTLTGVNPEGPIAALTYTVNPNTAVPSLVSNFFAIPAGCSSTIGQPLQADSGSLQVQSLVATGRSAVMTGKFTLGFFANAAGLTGTFTAKRCAALGAITQSAGCTL